MPGETTQTLMHYLNEQASMLYRQQRYEEAIPVATQLSELARTALGEHDPGYADTLDNLASLYKEMGNYAAAEPLCRQVLEIRRIAVAEDLPVYAASLNNLAIVYKAMGNYKAAEPLYRQASDIARQALSEHHPDYATTLNNLASLYEAMGNYDAAEPLCRRALEIRRQALGEDHPDYARGLNDLAVLYQAMGKYAAAEPLYRQALEIKRKALGEDHPDYARGLNNLAELYQRMGDYAAAERLLRQALGIRRKTLGQQHPDVAQSLNNLAALYQEVHKYTAAEPLLRQALEIWRKALGEDTPEYATSLNNLAILYVAMGNYAAAEPHLRQAAEIRRQVLGKRHPDYANSLNNLAELYMMMGNYTVAEPLLHQALGIRRKALGEDHHDVATSLNNLALWCIATNHKAKALSLMQQAAAIDDQMIGQVFSIGSESQRMVYLTTLEGNLHCFLSLVLQFPSSFRKPRQAGLELVLRRKAIGAEALAAQRDAVLGGRCPALEPKMQELTTWRRQIAQKALAGPGPEGLEAHQRLLAEWTAQKERLEEELARQIPEMHLDQRLRAAGRQAIAQALPEASALVEFVRFDVYDFKAVPARGEPRWKPACYLAFILPAKEPDAAKMVDLGEAEPIERMIAAFRASITGQAEKRDVEAEVSEAAAEAPGNGVALRAAAFDPLLPALGGRTRLFLAPDGDLARLPFEALPLGDGRCLIDDYQISYLSVGRDLLRFGAEAPGLPGPALVAADPDFDLGAHPQPRPGEAEGPLGRQSRDLDRGSLYFRRLPGMRAEGERIAGLLSVQPLLEGAVLEARLKAGRSPRILHIATHGFFLANQQRNPDEERLAFGATADRLGRLSRMENPLLRCGLALAGANTWSQGGALPDEAEDAILNGEDVTGLDLLGTDLVVLSACETGLGEVQVGEGVFGLRRAFALAGAKTLVMSLWKVPDQETQELMEDFYRRILTGRPRADALCEAQLAMKARHLSPLYWGAFICQGEPGPLQVKEPDHA